MGSKERIQRIKDENRTNILDAALQIVKEEGWQALSMRKIADIIEYTAPMIYEYFANKDAILNELANQGYLLLAKKSQTSQINSNRLGETIGSDVVQLLGFCIRGARIVPAHVWRWNSLLWI